ncbi:hypothetical protein ACP_0359 [Acidobacterium capsulatum ATCC 51196]|uniref:Uncharacterized protein n=1 Tax=Acidobacterium capsulatum (strain ATCC 51196 / DSM 11244 / BCRC 80197 / JCM 7670 / NBRC 15755 / NCIMB 13165 / 161) TaxID=240015 RepID=C1F9Y3_ACIC5|nr:hypothetical protein ACP_0359 [Acidobacterium capsulatum ATCC 51196]
MISGITPHPASNSWFTPGVSWVHCRVKTPVKATDPRSLRSFAGFIAIWLLDAVIWGEGALSGPSCATAAVAVEARISVSAIIMFFIGIYISSKGWQVCQPQSYL